MIIYEFVIAVYIDEKDTEKLKDLCVNNDLEFEDDLANFHKDSDWQENYRKETGFSGMIKRCYLTLRTIDKKGIDKLFDIIETADFDMMINMEIS